MTNTVTPAPIIVIDGGHYPPTLNSATVAEWLGITRQHLYTLIGTGELPLEPMKLGVNYRWPTCQMADALGMPYTIPANENTL